MKISNYTLEIEIDNKKYLYNSISNAFVKVDKEHYNTYKNIKYGLDYDPVIAKELKEGGFILDDDIDEKEFIIYIQNKQKYNSQTFGLTIAPTLQCNFRCEYCFEKHYDLYMSEEVKNLLIEFITNNIKYRKYSNLSITWYGGEPMLSYKDILNLSNELIKICGNNQINYDAGMITNGYLLNKDKVLELKEKAKINRVQITLDGIKEIHDRYRKLINNEGTLERNGANLSGGQKQKIAILRGIFSNPELIILDESTSGIDNEGEESIFKYLSSIKYEKIIILVTHNQDKLRYADEILYFKGEGNISVENNIQETCYYKEYYMSN